MRHWDIKQLQLALDARSKTSKPRQLPNQRRRSDGGANALSAAAARTPRSRSLNKHQSKHNLLHVAYAYGRYRAERAGEIEAEFWYELRARVYGAVPAIRYNQVPTAAHTDALGKTARYFREQQLLRCQNCCDNVLNYHSIDGSNGCVYN